MTPKLMMVIPFCDADAERAEKLVDWIYQLNDRKPSGHALILACADVHPEMKLRLQISCELAFEGFEIIQATNLASNRKSDQINHLFKTAAEYLRYLRWPYLWMEPDCVPLKNGWLEALSEFFRNQPKPFSGAFLKRSEFVYMARTSIYSANLFMAISKYFGQQPFEIEAAPFITPNATKCKLFQYGKFDGLSGLREDAVLFNGDKSGELIRLLRVNKITA